MRGTFLNFVLVAALLVLARLTNADGFDGGKWKVTSFDLGTKANPIDSLSPYHLRVHFPKSCISGCGNFQIGGMPVMLFVTGFAGQLDAFKYDVVLTGIARHGIIVVAVDQEFGLSLTLDYSKLGLNLQKIIAFIRDQGQNGLLETMKLQGFTNSILNGAARLIMAGHSSGAHVILQNMKDNALRSENCADAGGVVMLSPMDGQDALGFGGEMVVSEGKPLPFVAPALLIAGGLDGEFSAVTPGVACTPDDRGNLHFYKAWLGAINYVQAKGMGTLDILNEATTTLYDAVCAESDVTQSLQREKYRIMVRGAIVSFIEGVVLNDQKFIDKLSNPTDLNYPAELSDKGAGRAFSCAFVNIESSISFELQTGLILFGFLFAATFITGLYCFFRKMDDDTLHRYHPAEGMGYDQPASFQTKLEPQYGVSGSVANEQQYQQNSSYNASSRVPSVNV